LFTIWRSRRLSSRCPGAMSPCARGQRSTAAISGRRLTAAETAACGQTRTDMASKRGADLARWRPRRRRILLMIGLPLLGLAAWRFASRAAFADRAVTATAVIEDVSQGPFLASEDVRRSFAAYAIVRYERDGTLAQARCAQRLPPWRLPSQVSAGRHGHRRLRPTADQHRRPCRPRGWQASPAGPVGAGIAAHGRGLPGGRGRRYGAGSLTSGWRPADGGNRGRGLPIAACDAAAVTVRATTSWAGIWTRRCPGAGGAGSAAGER
jgi:hypothetical protein